MREEILDAKEQARRRVTLDKQEVIEYTVRSRKSFCDDPKNCVQYCPGDPAVYDSLTGLVPVKVLDVLGECYGFFYGLDCKVQIEWPDGNTTWEFPARVIPRNHIKSRQFSTSVDSNYKWVSHSKVSK